MQPRGSPKSIQTDIIRLAAHASGSNPNPSSENTATISCWKFDSVRFARGLCPSRIPERHLRLTGNPQPRECWKSLGARRTSITGWTSALGYNGTYTGSVGYFAERSQDPGGHSVELGYYNGVNAIEQTFGIAPNQPYLVSFWLATDCCNGPPAVLRVSAGGASADYQAPPPTGDWFAMGWQQHSFMFTSDNTASTTLWFGNVSGIVAIDAITVSPVPEPSTWAVFGLGALALLMARRRGNGTAPRSGGLL